MQNKISFGALIFKYIIKFQLKIHSQISLLVVACNLNIKELKCPAGQLLYIADAMYGRQSIYVCPNIWSKETNCKSDTSIAVVRANCHMKSSCKITANTDAFGDPCTGVRKYLEVRYQCVTAPIM